MAKVCPLISDSNKLVECIGDDCKFYKGWFLDDNCILEEMLERAE